MVVSHSCTASINQKLYAAVRQATGWEVSLVIPSNWVDEFGFNSTPERWPSFDGEIIPIPVRKTGSIILHYYRANFAKLIRSVNPDVVYVNHEPYAAATAQVFWGNRRAGGRNALRPIGWYSCQNILKTYPIPFRWTESWVLRSSQFAFPISSAVDEVFRQKGYTGPSTVLPLAIDPDTYRPHSDRAVVRRELSDGASDDTVLVGYVGRLVPEKGLATLMAAIRTLPHLPWRLAIIGAGPMAEGLKKMSQEMGIFDRVKFVGFVPHVEAPRLMSALDVLVLPSETQPNWREQFGRVLLEAMACGTPVVGTDSGEIPKLVRETGGGLVAHERDPADLAAALRRLILDPHLRSSLAEVGRSAVLEHYTIDVAAAAFARAIRATSGTVKGGDHVALPA
jgi:glycosyltransferase involved in cell wall biosynthesis